MAESDVESDFEGFDSEDIENADVRSIGSDISVSSVSSDESDSDEEDRQNIQWSRILRPPEVEEFTEDTGASFVLAGLGGAVGCASDWRPGGRGFDPRRGWQHSFVEIDHEIFSKVILSLPLIQEGQLSVSGERMCTILVNRLED